MSDRETTGLLKIVQTIGEENIQVQHLMEALSNVNVSKNKAIITFDTEKEKGQEVLNSVIHGKSSRYVSLVLWIPADKWNACFAPTAPPP